ncbi:MAG: TonB family protein, partial [Bacteroidetes bacterium]|nr:TonB family protein [Bacteroidota bacterium]
ALQGLTPNRDRYAEFLLAYALHTPVAALTNHFFNTSLLKSRITMLYKNKNSNWSLGKYAAVALLIGFISLAVASCEREVVPTSEKEGTAKNVSGKINVEGIVKGPDGKPLPGASITDGTQKLGTTTDAEGEFKMKVPAGTDLKVSYPGVGEMDLKVNPKFKTSTFDIAMVPGGKSSVATSVPSKDGEAVKVTMQSPTLDGETVFTVVEQSPEFPGGINAMYEFLGANIKYPEAAAKANVQGKVFLNFTITKEGEIRDIQILKGLGFGADQESIRVVSAMPRWKPGMQDGKPVNVKYNLPIAFQLEGEKVTIGETDKGVEQNGSEVMKRMKEGSSSVYFDDKGARNLTFVNTVGAEKALVVLDGVVQKAGFDLKQIKPESIQSISVLKGQSATVKYGEKGVNGVLEITTKK